MTKITESDWLLVCQIDDIPMLGARVIQRVAGPDVALFRGDSGQVFALLDRCPHKGGPLSQGIVHGTRVTCPLHGFNIALESGIALPPDQGCAQAFEIRLDEGAVYLKRAQLMTLGIEQPLTRHHAELTAPTR